MVPHVKVTQKHNSHNKSTQKQTLRGPHAMVPGITFNRMKHPNWLAVSCQDAQRVEVFDIEKCVSVFNRKLTYKQIRDCVWYRGNEGYLFVGCDDLFVHIYNTLENKKNSKKALVTSLASHKSCITSIDIGKKQYIISSSMDNTIKLWNLTKESNKKLIETHNDHNNNQIWKTRFNTKQDKLATIGDDGNLCLYTMRYN